MGWICGQRRRRRRMSMWPVGWQFDVTYSPHKLLMIYNQLLVVVVIVRDMLSYGYTEPASSLDTLSLQRCRTICDSSIHVEWLSISMSEIDWEHIFLKHSYIFDFGYCSIVTILHLLCPFRFSFVILFVYDCMCALLLVSVCVARTQRKTNQMSFISFFLTMKWWYYSSQSSTNRRFPTPHLT